MNKQPGTTHNHIPKKIILVLGTFVGAIVILALAALAMHRYSDWQFEQGVRQAADEADKPYREDTYGGKTPKETLELLITALEKNDFDLASKYFVLSKQEEWRKTLLKGSQENKLNSFIGKIKEAIQGLGQRNDQGLNSKNNYIYLTKDSVIFEFVKYPSGIWKIKEI